QTEADGPRVGWDRGNRAVPGGGTKSDERVLEQTVRVPAQNAGLLDRTVLEAMHHFDREALTVELADCDPSALRAEIDGGHQGHQPTCSSFRTARRRSRGRSGGGSRGPGSAVITFTPAARQASTSFSGA